MGGNRGGSAFSYISLAVILIFIVLLTGKLTIIPIIAAAIVIIWILTKYFPKFNLTVSTNINLMLTMLIGGLWHGSSWTFVLWGGLNGLGIVVYKFWRKISPYEKSNHWLANTWKIFFTFTFITFTRIWFRGESMQGTYDLLTQISTSFDWPNVPTMIVAYYKVLLVFALGLVIHWLPESIKVKYRDWFINTPIWLKIIISVVVVFIIYQMVSADLQPFIYFQF
jgi:hypothetical protein